MLSKRWRQAFSMVRTWIFRRDTGRATADLARPRRADTCALSQLWCAEHISRHVDHLANRCDEHFHAWVRRSLRTRFQGHRLAARMARPLGAMVAASPALERHHRVFHPAWFHRIGLAARAFCRACDDLHGSDRLLGGKHEFACHRSDLSADGRRHRLWFWRVGLLFPAGAAGDHADA